MTERKRGSIDRTERLARISAHQPVYTTGQVALVCRVASRTVLKWTEQGILAFYRIPGSQDRRITNEEFRRFVREHGIPATMFDTDAVVVATADKAIRDHLSEKLLAKGVRAALADNGLDLGIAMGGRWKPVVVVDWALGRAEAIAAMQLWGERCVLLGTEDQQPNGEVMSGSKATVFYRPIDPDALAAHVLSML